MSGNDFLEFFECMPATDRAAFGFRQTKEIANDHLTAASQLGGHICQTAFHLHILKALAEQNAIVFVVSSVIFVIALEDSHFVAEQFACLTIQERAWTDAIDLLASRHQMSGHAAGAAADI